MARPACPKSGRRGSGTSRNRPGSAARASRSSRPACPTRARATFTSASGSCAPARRAARRALGEVEAQPLLIVDDVPADTGRGRGSKVDRAKWDAMFAAGFPRPSFRVRTSPGNETWGWVLAGDDRAPERRDELALIRGWLIERGLTDAVMDETRYVRLPSGWNSKAKHRPEGAAVEASPAVGLVLEAGEPFPWERA